MERPTMDHNEALKSQACEKYLLGELSPALRDAYEEHYFSCSECALELRSAAEFFGASREIFAQTPAASSAQPPIRTSGWFAWLKPSFAIPAFAVLLLFIGYQNFVTLPEYKQAAAPRVLPMHSLITGNTRGNEGLVFSATPNEPIGLYLDIPTDAAYSSYLLRLEDPTGKSSLLQSVTSEEAQKTQVVIVNPGSQVGKYTVVISGVATAGRTASSVQELARLQFVIELKQ
jgi:hypothetical protein